MQQIISISIPLLTFILMFIVGMGLNAQDFIRIRYFPVTVIVAVTGQVLLLPLSCVILIYLLSPDNSIAMGILLLAISPGGVLSNLYTYLFKGNVALSITLTALTTVLAVFYAPILSSWLLGQMGLMATQQEIPTGVIFRQLFQLLLLPVVLGIVFRVFFEKFILSWNTVFQIISTAGILVLVLMIFVQHSDKLAGSLMSVMPVAVAFSLQAIGVGFLFSLLLGCAYTERIVLMIEFGVRNIPIALVLSSNLANEADVQLFAASFFAINACVVLVVSTFAKTMSKNAKFAS